MKKILMMLILALILVLVPLRSTEAKTLTIAVIDTGIDRALPNLCHFGHRSFVESSKDPLKDDDGHGSHVAGLISSNAGVDDYCLVSIKYYSPDGAGNGKNVRNMQKALQYAINIKVDFINISSSGPSADEKERALIMKALSMGIKIVVAAGNNRDNLDLGCDIYPACYDSRIVVVGNLQAIRDGNVGLDGDLRREPSSNYGGTINRWEMGTDVISTLPGGKTGRKTGTSIPAN